MGSLQTYKNKQNKKDPAKRVNVPYYHKVISRSRHKHSLSAAANPNSAIMLSKQLTLLERKKNSISSIAKGPQSIKISGTDALHSHHKATKSLTKRTISMDRLNRATA